MFCLPVRSVLQSLHAAKARTLAAPHINKHIPFRGIFLSLASLLIGPITILSSPHKSTTRKKRSQPSRSAPPNQIFSQLTRATERPKETEQRRNVVRHRINEDRSQSPLSPLSHVVSRKIEVCNSTRESGAWCADLCSYVRRSTRSLYGISGDNRYRSEVEVERCQSDVENPVCLAGSEYVRCTIYKMRREVFGSGRSRRKQK